MKLFVAFVNLLFSMLGYWAGTVFSELGMGVYTGYATLRAGYAVYVLFMAWNYVDGLTKFLICFWVLIASGRVYLCFTLTRMLFAEQARRNTWSAGHPRSFGGV